MTMTCVACNLQPTDLLSSPMSFMVQYAHILAVYGFGSASMFINILVLFSDFQCTSYCKDEYEHDHNHTASYLYDAHTGKDNKYVGYDYSVSVLVNNFTRVLFLMVIIMIPFMHKLCKFHICKKQTIFRYYLIPIMTTSFSMWLCTFIAESNLLHIYIYDFIFPNEPCTPVLKTACLNHSSIIHDT